MAALKLCRCCGLEKGVDQFYLSGGRPTSPCKPCAAEKAAARNKADPEARKATLAKWRATADRSAENARSIARQKEQRAANPNFVRAREREYYAANRERIAASKRALRAMNPEQTKATAKKHRETERGRTYMRVRKHERRAMEFRAKPSWYDREAVRQLFEVARVLSRSGVQFSVDHDIPLKHDLVCGLHTDANLVVMPLWQNIAKHNRFDVEAHSG